MSTLPTLQPQGEAQQLLASAVARRIEHMSDDELRILLANADADLRAENASLRQRVRQLEADAANLLAENERLMYKISRSLFKPEDYENFDPREHTVPFQEMIADAEKLLREKGEGRHL